MMRPDDPIVAPSRATAASVVDFARRAGAKRPAEVRAYLAELERLCGIAGFDFAILAAQSALETDNWRDARWQKGLNPAGIGATDGPDLSRPYASGREAAAAHVVHMAAYVYGQHWPEPLQGELASAIPLDPRYPAVFAAGWAGTVRTIADLSGKWASVGDYAERICARARDIWPVAQRSSGAMDKPTILVVAGHRSYQDAGNPEEKALTPALASAYERALEAAGYQVTHLQREWDTDADPDDTVGGLDTVGRKAAEWMAATPGPLVMIDCHYEGNPPSARGVFAIVPDKRHLGTAIAVPQPANDNWESNQLDVQLARAIATEISRETGLPLRTAGAREPGVMSETQTGVAYQYNARLAMFAYTAPYRDRAVRLVVEHGNLSNAEDRTVIYQQDFTERCARAVVRAIGAVYGQQGATPTPKPAVTPAYPPGMDAGIAAWRFGRIERGGKVYEFNPKGRVSRAWLKYGARYGYTPIVDVWRFEDGREYVAFGSFTLWRPNATEEFAPLESGEAGP